MLATCDTRSRTAVEYEETERILTDREKLGLRNTTLFDAEMARVDFSHADLRGSKFDRVELSGCRFRGANLIGVWFVECTMIDVDLTGASLGLNSFFGTNLQGVVGLSCKQRDYVVASGATFLAGRAKGARGKQAK